MTFKTGDKGQTRGGDDYLIVTVNGACLWVEIHNSMYTYHDDGMISEAFAPTEHDTDLLPPKQKIEAILDTKPVIQRLPPPEYLEFKATFNDGRIIGFTSSREQVGYILNSGVPFAELNGKYIRVSSIEAIEEYTEGEGL